MIKKKGSISLSINAVVIVVLAFIMLGLGVALTRGIFSNVNDLQGQLTEQVKQQIQDDLRTGNKPLSFPQSEVKLGISDARVIAYGIRNTGDGSKFYCSILEIIPVVPAITSIPTFQYDNSVQTLGAQLDTVVPVTVKGSSTSGRHTAKLTIAEYETAPAACPNTASAIGQDGKVYASKSFFIVVQ